MIVTIHQPNFAPWTGFFDKMAQSDVFVLLDNVPFTKGGFQNRVKIKRQNGSCWLTVPVQTKGKLGQATNAVETNELLPWRRDHLKTIEVSYAKAPYQEKVLNLLAEIYAKPITNLADLCVDIIKEVHTIYGLQTKLVRSSELNVSGSSSQLLADIVAVCEGDTYLSGPSGRNYLDEEVFTSRGINVEYHRFDPVPYPQLHGEFVGGLSMLDHLANCDSVPWWL